MKKELAAKPRQIFDFGRLTGIPGPIDALGSSSPYAMKKRVHCNPELRLTLFGSGCYSRRVPFGRGFSV